MLAVRTLRPLPPEGPLTQPALEQLREPGLHVVHAPPGYIMSENVAAVLGEDVAWLRLSKLEMHPACMAEALSEFAPLARADLRSALAPAELGATVANRLRPTTTLVIENTNGRVSAASALRLVQGAATSETRRVVLISHSRLHRLPPLARGISKTHLASDSTTTTPMIERAVSELGVPAVADLLRVTGGRTALRHDALAATVARDPSAIMRLLRGRRNRRTFHQAFSNEMLRTCSPAELQALSVAVELGYWSPRFGGDVTGSALRPWLIALADDWFWLRPLWRSVLRQQLELPLLPRPVIKLRSAATYDQGSTGEGSTGEGSTGEGSTGEGSTGEGWVEDRPRPSLESAEPADNQTETASESRHQLHVRMLGQFEVTVDGERVEPWEGRIPPMILAYLVAQERYSAERDRLLDTFWQDIEPGKARNRMHVALSSLRRSIRSVSQVDVVQHHQGRYRISPELEVQVDVDDFVRAAHGATVEDAAGHVDEALVLYRRAASIYAGDFLADSPYEEWTIIHRETHRTTYLEVLQRMAALLETQGRGHECVGIGQLMLRQDPCSEPAHRLLIRSYSHMGEHSRALRQFDLCRRTLDHVLGVRPSKETVEAFQKAKAEYQD